MTVEDRGGGRVDTGAIASAAISLVLPALMYLRTRQLRRTPARAAGALAVAVVGVAIGTLGVVFTALDA